MSATHPTHSELLKFAQGNLSQSARAQLYSHLEQCEQCRAIVKNVNERPPSVATPRGSGSKKRPELGRVSQENPTRQVTDLLIGATLGEYRVVERLGQGGMGVLYRAVQPLIGKEVAIKVVQAEIASDQTVVQRMIDEARAVNAARHQNIVDIFAFGQLPDGRPYMVMELLQGQSLADLLYSVVRLPWRKALEVLDQCFAGLEAAHQKGVIHRDLKPENIFIDQGPADWKVTLLDFGLATRTGQRDVKLTQQGTVVGTPGFMAPEQVQGMGEISPQTDVYAMGVVAWNMLTGREPFAGGSMVEVMHRHLTNPAPPIRPEVPEVPAAVEALVLRMMAKEPEQRPTDAAVREEIATLLGGKPAAPAPHPAARARLWAGLAIGALALVGAVAWALLREAPPIASAPPRPPRPKPAPIVPPKPAEPREAAADDGAAPASAAFAQKWRPELPAHDLTARFWRCSDLIRVTPVYESAMGRWLVIQAAFQEGSNLLVTDDSRRRKKTVSSLRKKLLACRSSDQVIIASPTEPLAIGWGVKGKTPTDDFLLHGGVKVQLQNIRLVSPPDAGR